MEAVWRYWWVAAATAASTASDAVMVIVVRALFMGSSWWGFGIELLNFLRLSREKTREPFDWRGQEEGEERCSVSSATRRPPSRKPPRIGRWEAVV